MHVAGIYVDRVIKAESLEKRVERTTITDPTKVCRLVWTFLCCSQVLGAHRVVLFCCGQRCSTPLLTWTSLALAS